MATARYVEIAPSASLSPWVVCYWSRAGFGPGTAPIVQRVLPDGCADVIFALAGDPFVVGTMTAPLVLRDLSAPEYLGVRFRPGRALLGVSLGELTDRRVPLRDLWGPSASVLAERVAQAQDTPSRIAVIETELLRRIVATDPRVDAAVECIVSTGGRASIARVAQAIGLTRQHLARQFLRYVGVGPKTFARVIRFERVVHTARRGRRDWAGLAAELGYFDQAHLIGEFRALAGTTPVPFFQSSEVLVP